MRILIYSLEIIPEIITQRIYQKKKSSEQDRKVPFGHKKTISIFLEIMQS